MFITSFEEANIILDTNEENCVPANALCFLGEDDELRTVTCWKVTKEELEEINKTGRVWLITYGEDSRHTLVSGVKPFEQYDDSKRSN